MANTTIGIFGGGQLGRMMAQAALPLNIQCTFLEASTDCPSAILGQVISSQEENGLEKFIQSADVFSLEFENTPLTAVDQLIQSKQIYPPRQALAIAQNRLLEKSLFDELDIPVAPYRAVDSLESLQQAVSDLGFPIVLKTATGGYDGKGQFKINSIKEIDENIDFNNEYILEKKITIIMAFCRIRSSLRRIACIFSQSQKTILLACSIIWTMLVC